jgi:transcriptional regulator with XRE-family HTH domain
MNEPHPATSLGPIMKAARKFKKFNQADVAHAIGCSQSALSKMEHSLLTPSAPQWFLFSRFTAIPPETIETGIIDRHSKVTLNDASVSLGYKLPKRYRINRAQKVREIYPLLTYLEKKIDAEAYPELMRSIGVEPEFFLDFDNIISYQFVIDLMNLFSRLGHDSLKDIQDMVVFGQDHLYWDGFIDEWKKFKSVKELLKAFGHEQPHFQADFTIQIQEMDHHLRIAFVPENHLYHFLKDVGPDTQAFVSSYRKLSLENLIKLTLDLDVEVREVSEFSKSPLENHFEIEF